MPVTNGATLSNGITNGTANGTANGLDHGKKEVKIFTPIGMLGYGYPMNDFWAGIAMNPDAIICDSGSTDSGPQKLALGTTTCPRESYIQDFLPILEACYNHKIKVLISSAGGDGSDDHTNDFVDIIKEISAQKGYQFRTIAIYSEINKDLLSNALTAGRISPCGPVPELTAKNIKSAVRVVAQMGAEPFLHAMNQHPDFDIIISGRAYDPAPYAAFAEYHGVDRATAYHMGKIMECGALCAVPKGKCAMATVRPGSFDIEPTSMKEACTTISVASHTLYEKSRPDLLPGPGGVLDLSYSKYEQVTDRKVRVSCSKFIDKDYTVKLEGSRTNGYRSSLMGCFRDPILISQLDHMLNSARQFVAERHSNKDYNIHFHVYGNKEERPKEVFVVGEVRAETQKLATLIASLVRIVFIHGPYPGQKATSGNFAMLFPPLEIPLGPVCEFNVYHLLSVSQEEAVSLFPLKVIEVGPGSTARNNSQKASLPANGLPLNKAKINATKNGVLDEESLSVLAEKSGGLLTLGDVASVIRSKNAGPYELTFDVMFPSASIMEAVEATKILDKVNLAQLYGVDEKDVIACMYWKPASAFKFTIPRPRVSGMFGEDDVHGATQHVPLMQLKIPV